MKVLFLLDIISSISRYISLMWRGTAHACLSQCCLEREKERMRAVSFFFLYEESGIFASYVLFVAPRARTHVPCSTDYCPLRQILAIIECFILCGKRSAVKQPGRLWVQEDLLGPQQFASQPPNPFGAVRVLRCRKGTICRTFCCPWYCSTLLTEQRDRVMLVEH
jgi:hypothetical protein